MKPTRLLIIFIHIRKKILNDLNVINIFKSSHNVTAHLNCLGNSSHYSSKLTVDKKN